ncbi:MAG: helix-turn-helix domain-containing protein [Clostridiales bacterium]|nr:helix-turn-helix domain-containing protein [Clostridiales bacterium]
MEIQLYREMNEKPHFHSEIELIAVVDGSVTVSIKEHSYLLNKEDVILVNSGLTHGCSGAAGSITCVIHFPLALVTDLLKNGNCIFKCNTVEEPGRDNRELHTVLHELILSYIWQNHRSDSLLISLLFRLLDCLVENYRISSSMLSVYENQDDVRLQEIFQYVNRNYQNSISLAEIAEHFYVSTSTLSRFFKKQTGIYFSEYVNQIKCLQASHELISTDKNITRLAMDCGFSGLSAFNKVFRDIYGMSPSDYRKTYQGKLRSCDKEQRRIEEIRENLLDKQPEYLKKISGGYPADCLTVDIRTGTDYKKIWNRVINVGSLYGLTMANIQFHTLQLVEQLGFQYVRVWSVFSEKLMITDGIHIGNYNYDIMDIVLDFLVEHHIRLFFDFGRRPDTIIRSETQPVFYGAEYIHFQSRRAWEAMFTDFIRHIVKRYGRDTVGQWIFELSFDSFHLDNSQYYESENYDMTDVYFHAWKTIKSVCPEAQVGGIGCVPGTRDEILRSFAMSCLEHQMKPDFMSYIMFPYDETLENDQIVRFRSARENFERDSAERMRQTLNQIGLKDCKLYLTEWNNTVSMRNFMNDSCFRAAYIAKLVTDIGDNADMIIPWIGSDWVTGYYDTMGIANGGNGYLTKDTIRKPAYFALVFLNYLGDTLVMKNDYCIVTRTGAEYYMLCWNFKKYAVNYYMGREAFDRPEKLNGIFENENPRTIEVTLEHLAEDFSYTIKRRTVNPEHGSLLNEWKKFQYDTNLTSQDVKYLRASCFPEMSMERRRADGGRLTLRRTMLAHEISVFHIYESDH